MSRFNRHEPVTRFSVIRCVKMIPVMGGTDGEEMQEATVWRMSRSLREVSLNPGVSMMVTSKLRGGGTDASSTEEDWGNATAN